MIRVRRDTLLVSLLAFATLAVWIMLRPASGEGDAVLHYLKARIGALQDPKELITAWGRPLFKLIIVLPSLHSMVAARLAVAAVAACAVGQTVELARDLKLPRPWLAGFFVLAQPFAFAIGGDVMTEMPAALAFLIAMRLWLHDRRAISCVVVSFTPLLRPEGFFLIVLWGVMVLIAGLCERRPIYQWMTQGLLLGVGMVAWCFAGWMVAGDFLYVRTSWFWQKTVPGYGHGTLWYHFQYLPWYLGSALLPLFLLGIIYSSRKKFWLVWLVWWLVIGVHSILFWKGWFGSLGLLRILVLTSPSTAVICLVGFNRFVDGLAYFELHPILRTGIAVVYLAWCGWVVVDRYEHDPQHQHYRLAQRAAALITSQKLLPPGTKFFAADRLMLVYLDYPRGRWQFVENDYDPVKMRQLLKDLPPGSVGVWDNRQSNGWFGISLPDFDQLGYETIDKFDVVTFYQSPAYMYRVDHGWPETVRWVVVRKR